MTDGTMITNRLHHEKPENLRLKLFEIVRMTPPSNYIDLASVDKDMLTMLYENGCKDTLDKIIKKSIVVEARRDYKQVMKGQDAYSLEQPQFLAYAFLARKISSAEQKAFVKKTGIQIEEFYTYATKQFILNASVKNLLEKP